MKRKKNSNLYRFGDDALRDFELMLLWFPAALFTGRPAATLEMFPSWPMRYHQTPRVVLPLIFDHISKALWFLPLNYCDHEFLSVSFCFVMQGSSKSAGGESTDSGSQVNTTTLTSKGDQTQLEPESPISKIASSSNHHHHQHQALDQNHLQFQQQQQQLQQDMAISDTSRATTVATGAAEPSKGQSAPKPNHEKVPTLLINFLRLNSLFSFDFSYITQNWGGKSASFLDIVTVFIYLSLLCGISSWHKGAQIPTAQKIKQSQSLPDFWMIFW